MRSGTVYLVGMLSCTLYSPVRSSQHHHHHQHDYRIRHQTTPVLVTPQLQLSALTNYELRSRLGLGHPPSPPPEVGPLAPNSAVPNPLQRFGSQRSPSDWGRHDAAASSCTMPCLGSDSRSSRRCSVDSFMHSHPGLRSCTVLQYGAFY